MGYNREDMIVFTVILEAMLAGLLVLVSGVRPRRGNVSIFELERRVRLGDTVAQSELERRDQLRYVVGLRQLLTAVLLVILTITSIAMNGWVASTLLSLVIAIFYHPLAQSPVVRRQANRIYERYETRLLRFIKRYKKWLGFVRQGTARPPAPVRPASKEELMAIIDHAGSIISESDRKAALSSLRMESRLVHEIMTTRDVIDSISRKELLGPLVLDDLHKTGHTTFPVTDEDLDHVVGVLDIQDLLTVDRKRSATVEKAMNPRTSYIHEDETLRKALTTFLNTHHHLLIVINSAEETTGLLTLGDAMRALLGQKMTDNFNSYGDARVVAAQGSKRRTD